MCVCVCVCVCVFSTFQHRGIVFNGIVTTLIRDTVRRGGGDCTSAGRKGNIMVHGSLLVCGYLFVSDMFDSRGDIFM